MRAGGAKEKEERGRTGIDRESKVTNAKVIVLLSHPVERIYRIPCDDTRFATLRRRTGGGGREEEEEEQRERGNVKEEEKRTNRREKRGREKVFFNMSSLSKRKYRFSEASGFIPA